MSSVIYGLLSLFIIIYIMYEKYKKG